MNLESLNKKFNLNIISDGEFLNLAHAIIQDQNKILSFCDDPNYIKLILNNNNISCLICLPEMVDKFKSTKIGLISSNYPRELFFKIHNELSFEEKNKRSVISKSAKINDKSLISDVNVKIGENTIIEENVIIRPNVTIGNNTIIRAGTIIGGDGFQFWKTSNNSVLSISHMGMVVIGNDVEIKEHCTIHKAVFPWDKTQIGDLTKIDSHSHIGHGNKIGNKVYLCSHSNISGNSIIGNNSYIGPGANIPNRVKIGESSKVSVGSTVTKNVDEKITVSGNFAILHQKYIDYIKNISKN